jgi:serine/threonine-protein kinase
MRPQDPFIGRDILNGQFQILQKIGSGGMGAVYKALQPDMNRMVGVKILHPKLANRKDLVSRFRREARAMSQLTHPNTVKVFMFGELDDGSLYIIMEFLEGKNLNQTVRAEGPFPLERALPVLIAACGALDEAHKAGIIHRDLKPENIFLVQSGGVRDYPKLLDFGLAKVGERQMRPGSVILTQEGMVFGTPEFMSPEQAQGKTLTPASDVYSIAVILYEVLTGKLPFDAKSAMDFIQLHVTGKPIGLSQRVPGKTFPPLLDQIMDRALAKKSEDRFQSAADFGAALQVVMQGGAELPAHLQAAPVPIDVPTAPMAFTPSPGPVLQPPPGAGGGWSPKAGPVSAKSDSAAVLPKPPSTAPLPAPAAAPARREGRSRQKAPTNVPMLVGVALGFLLLGIAIALAVTKLVAH